MWRGWQTVECRYGDSLTAGYHSNGMYASWAVQFHPHGGQFDFVWLPARTLDAPPWGVRVVRPTKSKKNTHPKNITALFRGRGFAPWGPAVGEAVGLPAKVVGASGITAKVLQ